MREPRELPHDLAAERQVLGACLLDAGVVADAAAVLGAGDFHHPAHGLIFEAIGAVVGRGEPLDIITLAAELAARGRLNTVGGAQYLGELTDTMASAAHAAQHARLVAGHAARRRLARALAAGAARAADPASEPEAVAEALAAEALDAAARADADAGLVPLAASIDAVMADVDAAAAGGALPGRVPWRFAALDDITTGMHPGESIVIAARPGVGKTSLAMAVALHAARAVGPVLVFSQEMPHRQLTRRVLAGEARVDQLRLRANRPTSADVEALTAAAARCYGLPVWFDDAGGATLHRVRAQARRLRARRGLALVVVDYLQLMQGAGENRAQQVGAISRGLKTLAKELDVPVLLLSQLNRSSARGERRPELHDLRESGDIEQDADAVLLLHREELVDPATADRGVCEINVAKQRNGPAPETVKLRFVREHTRFEDLPPEDDPAAPDARGGWERSDDGGDDGWH